MVAEKLFALQAQKQKRDLVAKLQSDTPQLFLERAMHEINDSLASVLAICDVEAGHTVPKIKKYIQRVNQSLGSMQSYQAAVYGRKQFNLSLVVENVMNVMEENFKGKVKMVRLITDLKAMAQGDPAELEEFLLHLLVELVYDGSSQETDLLVELRQKNQDAVITILKDLANMPENTVKELEERAKRLTAIVQMTPQVEGIEVSIRIPLVFASGVIVARKTAVEFHSVTTEKQTVSVR